MGETPRRSLRDAKSERRLANAALSLLASPLLPKGEASAKGEDRTADARGLATATLTPQRTGSPTKHFV